MEMMIMTEKERQCKVVKEKLVVRYPDLPENIIDLCVDDAANDILIYCNINDLPVKVEYTFYKLTCDYAQRESDLISLAQKETDIKSIKQGDTTFELNIKGADSNSTILKRYRADLNKFRKLVF